MAIYYVGYILIPKQKNYYKQITLALIPCSPSSGQHHKLKAKNIALRNMLCCLLWAAGNMVQYIHRQLLSKAPLPWQQLSPPLQEHNTSSLSVSYLTSRPDAGKQMQRRELPWSQLWPNLQHLYWLDEGWKDKANRDEHRMHLCVKTQCVLTQL